jgi:N-acetylmuramoyl-L-alanine amidase-like
VAVTEPVDFMSTHPEAYRQLDDEDNLSAVRDTEEALSARDRRFVPQDAISGVAGAIRNGDIIAATSTVRGLDVAHTGLALWIDGELHLLHAPLAGEAVQISRVSLAERIQRIDGQDGIMVARPSEPRTVARTPVRP